MKNGSEKSHDPMKALKMQRRLSNISYETRTRIKQTLEERDSFDEFNLLPVVRDSIASQVLAGLEEVSPTPVQRLAIPALLGMEAGKRHKKKRESGNEMQQFLLAAETGSGKTLAYVLPMIDGVKRAEAVEREAKEEEARIEQERVQATGRAAFALPTPETPDSAMARPRALVLLPTAELVAQVGGVIKSLSHRVKFRTALLSSSITATVIRSRLYSKSGVDVVVSTPHLISSIAESDPNILSRVEHLVIDEADSLLDRSFSPITSAIIDRTTPSLRQLVFCSATIPRSLDSYLQKRYPETRRLATPNLHAIPRRVQLSVVDIDQIPYQGNRELACAQVIWDIGKEASQSGEEIDRKILVFVNERETSASLAEYLRVKGIDAHGLSRDSDERKAAETLAAFTAGSPSKTSRPEDAAGVADFAGELAEAPVQRPGRKLANAQVVVTTDIWSRGIDTTPVRHVVLFDVPHTSIDFIHRLGRVGRMGRRGRGVVLVGRDDRKDIVKEVREGMFRGAALI